MTEQQLSPGAIRNIVLDSLADHATRSGLEVSRDGDRLLLASGQVVHAVYFLVGAGEPGSVDIRILEETPDFEGTGLGESLHAPDVWGEFALCVLTAAFGEQPVQTQLSARGADFSVVLVPDRAGEPLRLVPAFFIEEDTPPDSDAAIDTDAEQETDDAREPDAEPGCDVHHLDQAA